MTRKKNLFLTLGIALILFSLLLVSGNSVKSRSQADFRILAGMVADFLPVGEEITYDIKLGKLRLGRAVFRHTAGIEVDGRRLYVMTLKTRVGRFSDTETIYSDPQTLLPVKITRDILNWLRREKITEEYDQENFSVTITKEVGGRTKETVIRKDAVIQNAILLPHYLRRMQELKPGYNFIVNLPTRTLRIMFSSIDRINVPAGEFETFHFESSPRQIEIWISADQRRIPVKMLGLGAFKYAMVLKGYKLE
ncbi:DUF3108 domain-containing protein [Candidatus Omnitrophota bacterium]